MIRPCPVQSTADAEIPIGVIPCCLFPHRKRDACCKSQLWLIASPLPVLPFSNKRVAVHNIQ